MMGERRDVKERCNEEGMWWEGSFDGEGRG